MSPFRVAFAVIVVFAAYAAVAATSIAQGRWRMGRGGRIAAPSSRIVTFVPALVESIQQLWNIMPLSVIAYVLG